MKNILSMDAAFDASYFLNLKGELKRFLFVVIIVDLYKMLLSQF
jgi:hypothetical protein